MLLGMLVMAVIWSVGGIVGGAITGLVVRNRERSMPARDVRATAIAIGWTVALALGGSIGSGVAGMLTTLMHEVVNRPIRWGWGVIPNTIGLGVAGAIIGVVGSKLTLVVMEEIW